jgi:hypothetical protein
VCNCCWFGRVYCCGCLMCIVASFKLSCVIVVGLVVCIVVVILCVLLPVLSCLL